jgi:hypothetical protein
MNLVKRFFSLFAPEPILAKPTHIKKSGRQAQSLTHLVACGSITLADVGGNHPVKVVARLRQQGYIHRLGVPGGERWETNPRTGCDYKVYIWTGKVPEMWIESGLGRRAKARGGCA